MIAPKHVRWFHFFGVNFQGPSISQSEIQVPYQIWHLPPHSMHLCFLLTSAHPGTVPWPSCFSSNIPSMILSLCSSFSFLCSSLLLLSGILSSESKAYFLNLGGWWSLLRCHLTTVFLSQSYCKRAYTSSLSLHSMLTNVVLKRYLHLPYCVFILDYFSTENVNFSRAST